MCNLHFQQIEKNGWNKQHRNLRNRCYCRQSWLKFWIKTTEIWKHILSLKRCGHLVSTNIVEFSLSLIGGTTFPSGSRDLIQLQWWHSWFGITKGQFYVFCRAWTLIQNLPMNFVSSVPMCHPILLYSAILINQQLHWYLIQPNEIDHTSHDQAIFDSIYLDQLFYKILSVELSPRKWT